MRREKASKIAAILGPDALKAARVLEVGTGSGVIAAELALIVGDGGSVESVDVVDERIERDGYRFGLIKGTGLPFPDESFDIVVSNHVVEHVGSHADQSNHIGEVHRVLAGGGLLYLACPGRWAWMEPHFRLPFLSWLPGSVKDRYVRYSRRGDRYDCQLLSRRQARNLLTGAGFVVEDVSAHALRLFARETSSGVLAKLFSELPSSLLRLAQRALPTIVLVARKA